MKFDYRKMPNFADPNEEWVSRPLIPVRLVHAKKDVAVYALLDSGADMSLFHTSVANTLGLIVEDGRQQTFYGISGVGVDVWIHDLQLHVVGSVETINLEVGFTAANGVTAILGQRGFFEHYRITFERSKNRVELLKPAKS